MVDHGAANSNEDLVKTLQRAGVIQRWDPRRRTAALLCTSCGWEASAVVLQRLMSGPHGTACSESICMAMRLCSRDLFVPEEYREDAFMDTPIRVEEHDFNISAPHM